MLKAGIPMREIDRTDLHRYLQVLAFTAERAEHKKADTQRRGDSNKPVVELRRGTIDDFW